MDKAEFCQSFEGIIESYTKIIAYMAEDNRWLQEENNKLRAESVCHGDQCKLNEIERLREALEKIAHPVVYLKRKARKQGAQLNGAMAVALSNDVSWLKDIARQALEGSGEHSEADTV